MTEQLIQTPFGEFFAADNDLIAHHLATHGAHNISDLQVFLSFIRYGDTVVDIGAHIGAYAVAAAKKAGPRGAVIAFEGFAPTFEFLQRNIRQNDLNIKPVFGIVDNAERAYAIKFSSGNTGATRFNSINGSTPTIPVITNIKDHVETPVDVVKIDVEGMEANVLDSITDILRTDKPVIMIEISRVELAALLDLHKEKPAPQSAENMLRNP